MSRPLSKSSYRRQLEKKTNNELIEILKANGQYLDFKRDKKFLIDLILDLPDKKPRSENRSNTNIHVDKDAFRNVMKHFCYSIIIIMLLQAVFNLLHSLQIFYPRYKDSKHNQCPPNAICLNNEIKCIENFSFFRGFCLPNQSYSNQLSLMIDFTKNNLKKRAGLYKCNKAQFDWMSQDEIENSLIKNFQHKNRNSFNDLFRLTIDFLINESSVITKSIGNSSVFTVTDYTMPIICSLKSTIIKNVFIFSAAFSLNFYLYYINRKSIYDVQSDQCLRTLINFIKTFNGNEVAQSEVRSLLEPMVENPDAVWKYVKKKLKKSVSIGWKKEDGEIYFFSLY